MGAKKRDCVDCLEVSLYYAEALRNSVSGNPRFRLATSAGSFVTQSDAACNYDVDNLLMHHARPRVVLSLTRAGRVCGIERVQA